MSSAIQMLIIIAIFLSLEMSSMLVGEGALQGDEAAIRKALEDEPGIDRVIHLRTLHLGQINCWWRPRSPLARPILHWKWSTPSTRRRRACGQPCRPRRTCSWSPISIAIRAA